jgi:hypothetical protein
MAVRTAEPGHFLPFSTWRPNGGFPPAVVRKRTGRFRPVFVTPDRLRAQNRPFGFAPILVIQKIKMASRKRAFSYCG